MFKLDLEKVEEPEIKLPTSVGSLKKLEFQENIYFCFIDYTKVFDCVGHKKEPIEIRKSAHIHWLSGKCKVKPKCNCKGMGEQSQKILNIVKNVKQWQCFSTVVGSVN